MSEPTEKQIKFAESLAKSLGFASVAEAVEAAVSRFGTFDKLTRANMSQLIDWLKSDELHGYELPDKRIVRISCYQKSTVVNIAVCGNETHKAEWHRYKDDDGFWYWREPTADLDEWLRGVGIGGRDARKILYIADRIGEPYWR